MLLINNPGVKEEVKGNIINRGKDKDKNLDGIKCKRGDQCALVVNECMETSVSDIYAAGDCCHYRPRPSTRRGPRCGTGSKTGHGTRAGNDTDDDCEQRAVFADLFHAK